MSKFVIESNKIYIAYFFYSESDEEDIDDEEA